MMIKVNKLHRAMIDIQTKEIGIHRTQHRMLIHLDKDGMLPSQRELAAKLDITPAAVTVALKKLENDGYIERTLGQDTRYNEIKITEKGRELLDRTHELFLKVDSAMLEGFSDEELDSYIAYLERMQKNIQKQTKEHIQ
jgi:DNA-binding MarR family transcriptional regulator